MNENENTVEQNALTQDANVEQPNVVEGQSKTYTSEQVTDLMKKRIERSHNAIFNRYGVKSFEELDAICKGYRDNDAERLKQLGLENWDQLAERMKTYQNQTDEFGKLSIRNSELLRENAFLKNNINPEKYEDIIAHFKGKNVDFSEEELIKALSTHPEWLNKEPIKTTLKAHLGVSGTGKPVETDEQKYQRLFWSK